MTLVVYAKGELVADRAGMAELPANIEGQRNIGIPVTMVKLYVSRDKKIAFAYTGDEIDFNSPAFKKQIQIFRRVLSRINGDASLVSIRATILNEYSELIACIMTSRQCYVVNDIEKDEIGLLTAKLTPIPHELHYCHGSGRDIADLLLNTGSADDNDELYTKVAIFDMAVSPFPLDRIKHSDLKPLS